MGDDICYCGHSWREHSSYGPHYKCLVEDCSGCKGFRKTGYCEKTVYPPDGRGPSGQCSRRAVVERGGVHYCRQHDPEAVQARREANYAKKRKQWEIEDRVREIRAAREEAGRLLLELQQDFADFDVRTDPYGTVTVTAWTPPTTSDTDVYDEYDASGATLAKAVEALLVKLNPQREAGESQRERERLALEDHGEEV